MGKTSVLEAIHLLLFGKSYFTSNDKNNIKKGREFGRAECTIKDENQAINQVVVKLQDKKSKVLEFNGKKVGRLSEYIGKHLTVCISPEDIKLVKGLSSDRRSFLDQCIAQYNKSYTFALSQYGKALQQRNSMLKSFSKSGHFDKTLLEALNGHLCKYAPLIYKARKEFIEEFNEYFNVAYSEIAPKEESVSLAYESRLALETMASLLESSIEKDRILCRTNLGVHKDELTMHMHGQDIKVFGSQGQVKSYVIAMKMAQFQYLVNKTQRVPVFILDDMFDKLDRTRVEKILFFMQGKWNAQTFISDTDKERISAFFQEREVIFKHIHISSNQEVEYLNV